MKKVAIFCEGETDIFFLKKFIEHLGFKKNDVLPYIMGGKSNFFKLDCFRYKAVKEELENDSITKILFVLDADNVNSDKIYGGYENTQNEINKIIAQLGFENICDVYIMCDPSTKTGYLESLILSTIPIDLKKCIESFLFCSKILSKEHHKSIVNNIYNMMYPNKPYDFAHPHFEPLKKQLQNLFQ